MMRCFAKPKSKTQTPAKISDGQAYVTSLINAVMQGPDWNSTAIFLSWDDWGGFYDHVLPPKADEIGYGLRVPGLVISPYAKSRHTLFSKWISTDCLFNRIRVQWTRFGTGLVVFTRHAAGNRMPKQYAHLFHSLRFKTTLAVTSTLIVLLGAALVLWYARHREQEIHSVQDQAALTSDVIEASLANGLATQDLGNVQSIINHVGHQPGIQALYLLDANNQIRFSALPANNNLVAEPGDPIQLCATPGHASQSQASIYTNSAGEQILRYCRPLVNQTQCESCHNPLQPVLGTLISDYSLAKTTEFLNADLRDILGIGLGTLVACIVAVHLLLNHFAFDKLANFTAILNRFGQGAWALRLPVQGKDEIDQLASSFNQMADGLQTRDKENARLYRELQEKEAARTQLLQQIIANQEEDRKRLSRGLHDDFSQSLTALSMTMQTALQAIPPSMPSLRAQLEQLQTLTVDTLAEASRWIQDLRPRLLDDMGLEPAIRLYAESRLELSDTILKIEAHGLTERLPTEIETTLFRIIQEAVSNIAKYAHARHTNISIDLYENGKIVVRIEDDGVGFIPGKYLHSTDGMRGVGLLSMRERVSLLGGTVMIDSTPGRGTIVRAEVPWKTHSNPSAS